MTRAPARRWKMRARRQARFLRAYARLGTIAAGARAAGVPRSVATRWLETDPSFRRRAGTAYAVFVDSLSERCVRLALQGDDVMLRFVAAAERRSPPPSTTPAFAPDAQPNEASALARRGLEEANARRSDHAPP